MPADLTKPFDPSCCEGGVCNTMGQSAMPCGCDPGENYIAPSCWIHPKKVAMVQQLLANALEALGERIDIYMDKYEEETLTDESQGIREVRSDEG